MQQDQTRTLAEFFTQATNQYATRRAYTWRPTFRTLSWSYRDIQNHAAAFWYVLGKHGVTKGDRVILIAWNSPFWVAAFFGIHLKGAIAVPLSPESPPDLIKKILKQTRAKLILKSRFVATDETNLPTVSIEHIAKHAKTASPIVLPNTKEDDIAQIVYTSGTTGDPKGVVLSHKNILSNVRSSRKAIPVGADMRFASILPLFHLFEQVGGMLVPLSAGSQVSYAASLNPNHLRWIFQDDRITRMLAVPEFLHLMRLRIQERMNQEGKGRQLTVLVAVTRLLPFMAIRRLLFWRLHRTIGWRMITVVTGGAPLEKETGIFWEATGVYVLQGYGLTETSPVLCANRYRDRNLETVGTPFRSVSLRIAPDGEILAKGPNVFRGYWKNPKKTKEVFDENGWFHTGDIGEFDQNGHLRIKGRKKFMIVLPSGEKVHAEDVEARLNKEPGVLDSAVVGLNGEEVHAVLLLDKIAPDPKRIIERANTKLLPYQRIQSYSVWPGPDFPRTPTKKIKRGEVIRFVEAKRRGKRASQEKPLNLSTIERIIAQVLEVKAADIKDGKTLVGDFNLDSLRRIELVARIENELSTSLDESEITPQTTVADLKEMIKARRQKHIRYPFKAKPFTKAATLARKIYQPVVLTPIAFLYAPRTVRGTEHLDKLRTPALFFSNHIGGADAPVLYAALPARIRTKLATGAAADRIYDKEALWWVKIWRGFFEFLLPIFPFAREGGQGKASLVYTGRIIDRGFSVLLFPEGQTSKNGKPLPLKQGAGLLGVEMRVPIVPLKLEGAQHIIPPTPEDEPPAFQWPERHRVTVTIGKPLLLESGMDYEKATRVIQRTMRAL